jgi:hypothetical protein
MTMPNKDSAKLRDYLDRKMVVSTVTVHEDEIDGRKTTYVKLSDYPTMVTALKQLLEAHTAAQVAAADWQATKEVMPPVGQMVLCHITYDGSPEPTYAVLKHVDEDDCDWRTADDDSELSYWVNVTHWKPFVHLTTGQKEQVE